MLLSSLERYRSNRRWRFSQVTTAILTSCPVHSMYIIQKSQIISNNSRSVVHSLISSRPTAQGNA